MGKRTNGGRGKVPEGQNSRGFPAVAGPNPKNHATRRPDHVGNVPGEGGAANMGTTRVQTSDAFPSATVPNRFGKGSSASLPNPDSINRGYTEVGGDTPNPVTVSANRQRYGIDPGDVKQPSTDSTPGPKIPKFGVGTTGD